MSAYCVVRCNEVQYCDKTEEEAMSHAKDEASTYPEPVEVYMRIAVVHQKVVVERDAVPARPRGDIGLLASGTK